MSDDPKSSHPKMPSNLAERAEERGSLTRRIQYLEQELAENRKKLKELNDATDGESIDPSLLEIFDHSATKKND